MNERIRQLMAQTLDSKFSHTWTTMDYNDVEKFADHLAELIVRECARVYWNIDDGEIHSEYVAALKKHFGIDQ